MDCKEFRGLIRAFLDDSLDEFRLAEFLDHYDECEDCRDELRIHYLIYEGLERLGSGDTFDVDKDLAKTMELQRKRLRTRNAVKKTAIAWEILTVATFTIVISVILFYQ